MNVFFIDASILGIHIAFDTMDILIFDILILCNFSAVGLYLFGFVFEPESPINFLVAEHSLHDL